MAGKTGDGKLAERTVGEAGGDKSPFQMALSLARLKGHAGIVEDLEHAGEHAIKQENFYCSPLYKACKMNNVIAVERALQQKTEDLNSSKYGCTMLYKAIEDGKAEIVQVFLHNLNQGKKMSNIVYTPLSVAAYNGHVNIIKSLLKSGMTMKVCYREHECSAINMAAEGAQDEAAEVLLEAGCDADSPTQDCIEIFVGIQDSLLHICEAIFEDGTLLDKFHFTTTPIQAAAVVGSTKTVKLLMNHGCDIEAQCAREGGTALFWASIRGQKEVVKVLLDAGCNKEAQCVIKPQTLNQASRKVQGDRAKDMPGTGCDEEGIVPGNTVTALMVATVEHHVEVVKLLLDAGCDTEAQTTSGDTALHLASGYGHADIVKLLLAAGCNKDAHNKNFGFTPLIMSILKKKQNVMKVLLLSGCDVEAVANDGASPIIFAAMVGNKEAVSMLLNHGCYKEAQSLDSGGTALIEAATAGHGEVVRVLLCAGCNIEATTDNGITPLIAAASGGHVEVVQKLLNAGCNKEARAANGVTALIEAITEGHDEVVHILRMAGCNADMDTLAK